MEDYNRLISAKVLDGYDDMIDIVPQPQMLGGKRMRNFVLPASTEYDYPASLSVGRMDGQRPASLAGDFWNDFGDSFPTGSLQAGAVFRGADGKIYSTGQIHPKKGGKFNLGKALKSVGKELAPVAKDVGKQLVKEGVKQGVKAITKGGRRKKTNILASVGKALKSVGKELAPVAKDVFHDVIVPEGKQALKTYIKKSLNPQQGAGRRKKLMGADPLTYTPMVNGGVLIRDEPSQFHSNVYPPALASYNHAFPVASRGSGRAKLPKSGAKRNSARGAIVSEIMKKHGMSLPEASRYVKEKGLY